MKSNIDRGVSPVDGETRAERLRRLSQATVVARHSWEDARAARDIEISDADAEGMSINEIARNTKLSPGHVQRTILGQVS
jgi:hypothetical protein